MKWLPSLWDMMTELKSCGPFLLTWFDFNPNMDK